jgi:hypothetical protein
MRNQAGEAAGGPSKTVGKASDVVCEASSPSAKLRRSCACPFGTCTHPVAADGQLRSCRMRSGSEALTSPDLRACLQGDVWASLAPLVGKDPVVVR